MSLADDLLAPPPSTRIYCGVAKALSELDTETAERLRAALADFHWTAAALARTLAAHDINVNDQSISRHRRGDCRCPSRTT